MIMEKRNEIISKLQTLLSILDEKNKLEQDINELEKTINKEMAKPFHRVENFDYINKERFISQKVGEKPVKPSKTLILAGPIYIKKCKEYDDKFIQYHHAKDSAEKEYYTKFEKERNELIEKDKKEREIAINKLSLEFETLKTKYNEFIELIDREDIVGESVKNSVDIKNLIDIFDNKRADSLKEAVNILYEDKHRKRMEELQEEQVRLTQEAKDAAKKAIDDANEALERAEEAYTKAEEAYAKAEEAYSKADEAYDEASLN